MPVRESYTHGTPSWVDLMTTDPAAAADFYGALFGWDFQTSPTPDGQEYTMASKDGHAAAGMGQQNPEQVEMGIPPMWNTYITVDDIETAVGKVEGAGGSVMMPTMEVMEAGHMAVVVDPAGAVVCMWQAGQHIGSEVVNEHGALIWNELITNDLESSGGFMKAVFDLDTQEQEMPGGMIYTLFMSGEETVGGMMPPPQDGIPNHWAVYFAVSDIDSAKATALEQGGSTMGDVIDVPEVGKMLPIIDPQGAMFMLMQPAGETN